MFDAYNYDNYYNFLVWCLSHDVSWKDISHKAIKAISLRVS